VRRGTDWHGSPSLRFHASPTFVLEKPLNNFNVGRTLVKEAPTGLWGKAETHRLGRENSEDAVTWNVFRAFQEAGELHLAALEAAVFCPSCAVREVRGLAVCFAVSEHGFGIHDRILRGIRPHPIYCPECAAREFDGS
jgi:hypothetical protein